MVHYEKNITVVLDALAKCQYDRRSLLLAEKCYAEFKDYMANKADSLFTLEKAIAWCETKVVKTYRSQFKNAIYRLYDVYEHNHVIGSHLKFYGPLPEYYARAIDSYRISLSKAGVYSKNSLRRVKEVCTQFCLFLQANGVYSADEVGYTILEKYHKYIQESFVSYQELEGIISRFLEYLAENRCWRIGFSLFMHYVGRDKCTSCSALSTESRIIIEKRREASIVFPSDEFYNTIPDFTNRLKTSGYSEKITHNVTYHLTVLYLFLNREELGYDKVIADAWLKDVGYHLFGSSMFRKARRTIEMYEDYHVTGDVIPKRWWKHSITAYDILPMWCKVEIDCFLTAKTKEGCSEGTVVGIKTHVVSFCQFLASQGIAAFTDVTPEVIKKFNVQDQHKTPAGKNLYNRHIRRFLIYLELKQVVPSGVHFALPHCATDGGKIVEVLSQEDRTRIRAYCEKASTPLELRDAAILKIGMTTALRSSDIVALKISDIDWKNRMIRIIQSKTKVEHLHPMETGTGNAIFKYLQNGRSRKADNSYLFIAVRAPYGPLKREACSKSMKRAGTISIDFHRLRRTYATDMLNAGVTFSETAELLGHTDTQNIHKYAALDQDRMRLCPLSMAETGLVLEDRYGHE